MEIKQKPKHNKWCVPWD